MNALQTDRARRMARPLLRSFVPVLAGLVLVGAGWAALGNQEQGFPHERHAALFPVCTGCHEGVAENDWSRFYPDVETCNQCHTGDQARTDTWTERGPRVSNLKFQHGYHETLFGAAAPTCEGCHVPADGSRMAVTGDIQMETCWTCHGGPATEHVVDAPCTTCHVPLAETSFTADRIATFGFPADHIDTQWLPELHGESAESGSDRCAVCHTQDRCAACHVSIDRPAIQAIAPAPEGMELPPTYGRYVAPATHVDEGWLSAHPLSASLQECGTCHTAEDCMSCHVQPVPNAVADLPSRSAVPAPGVRMARQAPESHESFFFIRAHPTLAASDGTQCATCHEESFCIDCHDGPPTGGYHPPSFVSRHQAEAYGQETECASCHNTQAFCRSCHLEGGLEAAGKLGPGFHDAQALWLLRHGQAARQNLETCASCHAQNDCTQCHGVLGAFKVNPHSSDFDARAAWRRNPRTCMACHVRNPIGGAP